VSDIGSVLMLSAHATNMTADVMYVLTQRAAQGEKVGEMKVDSGTAGFTEGTVGLGEGALAGAADVFLSGGWVGGVGEEGEDGAEVAAGAVG
jgi:hypothetical protein